MILGKIGRVFEKKMFLACIITIFFGFNVCGNGVERCKGKLYEKYSNVFSYRIDHSDFVFLWAYTGKQDVVIYIYKKGRKKISLISDVSKIKAFSIAESTDKDCVVLDGEYLEYKYLVNENLHEGKVSIDCQNAKIKKKIYGWLHSLTLRELK